MKSFHVALAVSLMTAALGFIIPAYASEDAPPPAAAAPDLSGLHDFDFWIGDWRVHHRRLKERLAGSHEWIEFEGTSSVRKTMNGWGNVDDNFLDMPGGAYYGVGIRSYDPKTARWAIWWLDGRDPFGNLDPPVKGRFDNGVGTFYADDTFKGKPIRVRFTWSHITATSARWEQAFSPDGGKTWETNWLMEMQRVQ